MQELGRIGRVVLSLTLLVLDAAPARADGGVLPILQTTGIETAVEVKAQRAVIWQKADALELTIEPIFNWTGEGAWVIPLPALPAVSAGDPMVLDDLDQATRPVFLRACADYGCHCGDDVTGGGAARLTDARASTDVAVWSSGSAGPFDYVVLSATGGDRLADWAETNGFLLGEAATAIVGQLEVEGTYFFLARVSPNDDPARALPPVTFRFGPDVEPFYPMRLTGALMPEGATIDILLWLVAADVGYEPVGWDLGARSA